MRTKGLNSNDIKIRNRTKILKILRNERGISRKDISEKMELTKSAISGIISELINENIILETGYQETGVIGRNKILLELNKEYGYVLGLSVTETHLTLLISNILGETIDVFFHEFSVECKQDDLAISNLIIEKSLSLLWTNGIDKNSVIGFGIGYIGELDVVCIEFIKEQISLRLELVVVTDNNVKALAMSQMDFAHQMMSDNFLFIKYGPGLGMTIVQNGNIIEGFDHKAGEIGHTIIESNANTNITCRCGRRGCLESLISEKGIIKDIEKLSAEYSPLIINKHLSIIDYEIVNDLIEKRDQDILSIFEPRYDYFAKALANGIILFNPEYICVYGIIFNQPNIFNMIKNKVSAYLGISTEAKIRLSNIDPNNSAIGPAALALRTLFYDTGGYVS